MSFKPFSPIADLSTAEYHVNWIVREFRAMRDAGSTVHHAIGSCAYKLIEVENGGTGGRSLAIWNSNASDKKDYVGACLWRVTFVLIMKGLIGETNGQIH